MKLIDRHRQMVLIALFVLFLVPPRPPVIVNESGRESGSFLGPYPEGTTVRTSCEVSGGKTTSTSIFYVHWPTERLIYTKKYPPVN